MPEPEKVSKEVAKPSSIELKINIEQTAKELENKVTTETASKPADKQYSDLLERVKFLLKIKRLIPEKFLNSLIYFKDKKQRKTKSIRDHGGSQ